MTVLILSQVSLIMNVAIKNPEFGKIGPVSENTDRRRNCLHITY